jgi:hypothetical protein
MRTKRFKIKINTKKQCRQYKRKNTHRKHSHKLRKNKRVMWGGVNDVLLETKSVTLKYKPKQGFGRFRVLNGEFDVELRFETAENIDTMKLFKVSQTLTDTVKKGVEYAGNLDIFNSYFIPETPDTYKFNLVMVTGEMTFKVNFVVRVKKYKFRFFKNKHTSMIDIELFDYENGVSPLKFGTTNGLKKVNDSVVVDYSDVDEEDNGITYSSGDKMLKFRPLRQNNSESIIIVPEDNIENKYAFPIDENRTFFSEVYSKMINKITQFYKDRLVALIPQTTSSE